MLFGKLIKMDDGLKLNSNTLVGCISFELYACAVHFIYGDKWHKFYVL